MSEWLKVDQFVGPQGDDIYPHPDFAYDFKEALWGESFWGGDSSTPIVQEAAPAGRTLPMFGREDMLRIVHYAIFSNGKRWTPTDAKNAESNQSNGFKFYYGEIQIFAVIALKDGRYASVEAGCDTSGWSCQAGSDIRIGSLEDVIKFGLTTEGRNALGLEWELKA